MRILTKWLCSYVPDLPTSDAQLAEDLTLRGIAVEGIYSLGQSGSLYEMDITTNRVDAMNHYGIAREAAAIYGVALKPLDFALPAAGPAKQSFSVRIEAEDACGRFTARVLRDITIAESRDWFPGAEVCYLLRAPRAEADLQRSRCDQLRLARHGPAHARLRSRQD